ncbi:MAG: gliding motility-associated ABC transporter substrate-binding protein GldG [Bacteroidales bacterium]|nr:gliding motility-associated ABC transporter substrate-binding protein GldG [Bacteroidales bacterium]MBN2758737.1 gliding motility-associated ABC transporter substrate-binding protein GldG [Bacteroidales bacterium]
MSKKNLKKQSLTNLLFVFIIIILVNYISSFFLYRIDLTSERKYSLSNHSKEFLSNLNNEVYIKIYLEGDDLPISFKKMRRAINDLLEEFQIYANKNIDYQFINPSENPDKKARFGLYKQLFDKGIVPIESHETTDEGKSMQKMIFPGAIVVYKGKELGISLLKNDPRYRADSEENINNSIQSLEYEFTNAIKKLSNDKKQEIAFIEGHGELDEYSVMDISNTLSEYYDVKRGFINGTIGILDAFSAIIIAQPIKEFTEQDKLVIDQYIMKGGKVLWLIDGANIILDSLKSTPVNVAMPLNLNLEDQLFRYGVRINQGLVQDLQCSAIGMTRQDNSGQTRIDLFPWTYFPVILSDNNHEINKYLSIIRLEFPASIDTVGNSDYVKKTVLLHSSVKSKFDYSPTMVSIENVQNQIDESGFTQKNIAIAVLLEGKFDSNFKNRTIDGISVNPDTFLKQSSNTKMIIVSSGDILKNNISAKGEIYPIGFDLHTKKTFNGNKEFILNSINYLCDDEGLMSIRLREIKLRLLNKDKLVHEKLFWKSLNTILPIFAIIFFGLIAYFLRKRKYTKDW